MTPNKFTKNNILEMYNEINTEDFLNKENYTKILAFQSVMLNERECCIHQWYEGSTTKPLTPRNIICFINITNCLDENDLKGAWWELIDILTDVHDDEYLEIDELILFSLGLDLFIKGLHKGVNKIH